MVPPPAAWCHKHRYGGGSTLWGAPEARGSRRRRARWTHQMVGMARWKVLVARRWDGEHSPQHQQGQGQSSGQQERTAGSEPWSSHHAL